jgi:hypothetical protein
MAEVCEWCGEAKHKGLCWKVKAIEYHENGAVKRVEFETPKHIHEAPQPSVIIHNEKDRNMRFNTEPRRHRHVAP